MTVKLLWVVETLDTVKGFETEAEATAFEKEYQGRNRLLALLDSCQSYDDFYRDEFVEFFKTEADAQMVVDYLQSLIDVGKVKP